MSTNMKDPMTLERIPMEEAQDEKGPEQERRMEAPSVRRPVPEEKRRRMVREAMRLLRGREPDGSRVRPPIRRRANR